MDLSIRYLPSASCRTRLTWWTRRRPPGRGCSHGSCRRNCKSWRSGRSRREEAGGGHPKAGLRRRRPCSRTRRGLRRELRRESAAGRRSTPPGQWGGAHPGGPVPMDRGAGERPHGAGPAGAGHPGGREPPPGAAGPRTRPPGPCPGGAPGAAGPEGTPAAQWAASCCWAPSGVGKTQLCRALPPPCSAVRTPCSASICPNMGGTQRLPAHRFAPRLCGTRRGRAADRSGCGGIPGLWCCWTSWRRPTGMCGPSSSQVMEEGVLTRRPGAADGFPEHGAGDDL